MFNRLYTFGVVLLVWLPALLLSCSGGGSHQGEQSSAQDTTLKADSAAQLAQASPEMKLTYEERQGKTLYSKYCSVCHGDDGKGDGFNSFNLDPKPRDFTDAKYMSALSNGRLLQTISEGGRGVNKSPLMPSWGGRMDKMEIQYVIAYIRTFAAQE